MSRGEYLDTARGYVVDLTRSTLRSLSNSDIIIFWSQDDIDESLEEFLDVCFRLNWALNTYNFPARGVMTYDEIEMIQGSDQNNNGGTYSVNTMYGKGLVNAHLKCEQQNWAGTTVNIALSEYVESRGLLILLRLAMTSLKYRTKLIRLGSETLILY